MSGVTYHFVNRAVERIGCTAEDAVTIGAHITSGIKEQRPDVKYIGRVNRDGHRLFRFHVPDGRTFFALVNTETMTCITILPPGFRVPREKGDSIKLKEHHL